MKTNRYTIQKTTSTKIGSPVFKSDNQKDLIGFVEKSAKKKLTIVLFDEVEESKLPANAIAVAGVDSLVALGETIDRSTKEIREWWKMLIATHTEL